MTVIFDFDGTLANTLDIFISIYNNYIVKEFNCKPFEKERLAEFQNKRPSEFMSDFGVTTWKLPFIAFRARNLLRKEMINVQPFSGIIPLLAHLKQEGINMGIVTSNSEKNVRLFLSNHGISEHFQFLNGGRSLLSKQKALESVIRKYKMNKADIIYIGDEIRDILSCQKVGIPCIAVTWGHQKGELLASYRPNSLVATPSELLQQIMKWKIDRTVG